MFEVKDNKHLIDLAAVRQQYIDQSQSLTLFYTEEECKNASQLLEDILYAWSKKIKTLYYSKTPKANEVACESCT